MSAEPPCSLADALALVREWVHVEGPEAPTNGRNGEMTIGQRDWRWLIPVLLAWGRVGQRLTVIPEPSGLTLQLAEPLAPAAQQALQAAWQGQNVPTELLPVDAWDWCCCRLLAGWQAWQLTVAGDRLVFTVGSGQRWLVVSAQEEVAQPLLTTLRQQGHPVLWCQRADEALTRLRSEVGFSHVAIDRQLPVVDGDTLACTIANDPQLAGLQLVALGEGPLVPPWHQTWTVAETATVAVRWVDWEGLRQICEGDRTLAQALLQQFFETMPEGMQKLTEALAAADNHRLAQTAHYLKGVAATAHVYRLPALCHALQEAVSHGDPYRSLATLQAAWSEVMAAQPEILGAIAQWPEVLPSNLVAVRKLRILLADDDEGTLAVLTHALQDIGTVTTATCGEEAWQYLETQDFDVAVCDWSMPDTSGIVLCQRLRWVVRSALPFVLLTARADENFRQLAFTAGVSRYFVKPVHPVELRAAVLELGHGG